MKKSNFTYLLSIFLFFIFIFSNLSGCIKEKKLEEIKEVIPVITLDKPSILPDWIDGQYHDYYETTDKLTDFKVKYPDLVNVFSIGKSVLGKEIWCIRLTNEKNRQQKYSCLIDGCIHGCEWEAGDACLYLAEYLLINFNENLSITNIINKSEVYIVPLLNPDSRQVDYRFNENGIDLNRNFDIDFGRLRGGSIRLGKLFGRIKIPYLYFPILKLWFTNCGRRPFSEPETQALRDLMKDLDKKYFSFYLSCHTAIHSFTSPWSAFKPPFEMTSLEKKIHNYVKDWVGKNTEYENTELSYFASGTSTDWCFKEFRVATFTLELLSKDYEPGSGGGKHDNLVHWMKTTLPVFMYLLVNIENIYYWQIPDIEPLLPEGVPPAPI